MHLSIILFSKIYEKYRFHISMKLCVLVNTSFSIKHRIFQAARKLNKSKDIYLGLVTYLFKYHITHLYKH